MAVVRSDLVSYWSLGEASGTRVDSEASNDLTVVQGTPGNTAGIQGNACLFDDANPDEIGITDAAQSGLDPAGNMTICGWFRGDALPSAAGDEGICGKFVGTNKAYRVLWLGANDRLYFYISGDGSASSSIFSDVLSANTTYFFCARYDGTNIELRVDSTDATPVAYSSGVYDGTAPFNVGDEGTGRYMSGWVDELSFWKEAMSDAQVASMFNSGSGLDYAGTVALFGISVTPANADVQLGATNPTVNVGSLSVTPSNVDVQLGATNPTVNVGQVAPISDISVDVFLYDIKTTVKL